jgi:hypothetical protein
MPVKIIRGSYAGSFGYVVNNYFDGCAMYEVKIPGSGPQHPLDYIMEEIPDRYVHVPAANCAIYYNIGTRLTVKSNGWASWVGYSGPVTKCEFNEKEQQYYVTIHINAEQFPAYACDYLPSDQDVAFPAYMLS